MDRPRTRVGVLVGRALLLLLLLLTTVALAGPVGAQSVGEPQPLPRAEPTFWHKAADVTLSRPLSALRLGVGIVALPLAWPVAAILGDPDWAVEVCVREPSDYLFERPLGVL